MSGISTRCSGPPWRRSGELKCVPDTSTMASELDHLFICASIGAPEADRLVAFGLTEGTPNAHPGQGTANRRFFFHNAMLELLWVQDAAEAQSELVRPTRLWERWAGRSGGACPLALCFRPKSQHAGKPPFPTWE